MIHTARSIYTAWIVWLGSSLAFSAGPSEVGPRDRYAGVSDRLRAAILHEIRDKNIPAISIALVEGKTVVWAAGFGMADPEKKVPASARTVYRVGSISKLLTDVAVVQLVEQGKLDLDAQITDYLPDFRPRNPFGQPITLRQLMSHRAGLVRESPVGNYFDPTEPSLAETVASLNQTELVYAPTTRTKYSNAGVAVVGYVLERTQKVPFSTYVADNVLKRLRMDSSAFERTPAVDRELAKATMWTYDGREFAAPTFALGTSPAGNLYSTVGDLAKFVMAILGDGSAGDERFLKPETIEQMFTPQFSQPGDHEGFGLGFHVSRLDGRRLVGHSGAVYGFSSELALLPEEKIGAVVLASKDVCGAVVNRLAQYALRAMLAVNGQVTLPEFETTEPVPPQVAREVDGRYAAGGETIELSERNGQLFLRRGSSRLRVRSLGDELIVDDADGFGPRIRQASGDRLIVQETTYQRVPRGKPAPPPQRWEGLIGEYGGDHNTLFILEDEGQLVALIEWFYYYPLKEIDANEFAFPDYGLYHGEKLVFSRDAGGRATQVVAANVLFKRREVGTRAGETFRIQPVKPVDELRAAALAAVPPRESGEFRQPDLVEVTKLEPTVKLDVRYATTNNFMGSVFYQKPRAFLQRPAAKAVVRAHQRLKERGYGILIHDGYRPWYVTKMFWDATPEEFKDFVADPQQGSRHNRGAAVDLTLYELSSGKPVSMVSGYDEFSPRSFPDYPGGTSLARWHRELLRDAMEAEGFTVYQFEWWHFDYQDWQRYPILNTPLEGLTR